MIGPLVSGVDLTQSIVPGSWMAWTWAGATFFVVIAALLIAMIVWGAVSPETPRHGALGIETTPGDRLFISLLGSAFINLAWLAAFGSPLWGALAVSLLYASAVFRWV
jgi:predicted small integral membrane protein